MLKLFLLFSLTHPNSVAILDETQKMEQVELCRNSLLSITAGNDGDYAKSFQVIRGSFIHKNQAYASSAFPGVITITTNEGSYRLGPGKSCVPTGVTIYDLLAERIHNIDKTILRDETPKVTTKDVLDALKICKDVNNDALNKAVDKTRTYFEGLPPSVTKTPDK